MQHKKQAYIDELACCAQFILIYLIFFFSVYACEICICMYRFVSPSLCCFFFWWRWTIEQTCAWILPTYIGCVCVKYCWTLIYVLRIVLFTKYAMHTKERAIKFNEQSAIILACEGCLKRHCFAAKNVYRSRFD